MEPGLQCACSNDMESEGQRHSPGERPARIRFLQLKPFGPHPPHAASLSWHLTKRKDCALSWHLTKRKDCVSAWHLPVLVWCQAFWALSHAILNYSILYVILTPTKRNEDETGSRDDITWLRSYNWGWAYAMSAPPIRVQTLWRKSTGGRGLTSAVAPVFTGTQFSMWWTLSQYPWTDRWVNNEAGNQTRIWL